jgi:hypothetical protein
MNEICAVCLDEGDGGQVSVGGLPIEWSGLDICVSGYGSAICEGLFTRPDLFPEFVPALNPSGIFDRVEGLVERYRKVYLEVAAMNPIEPMPDIANIWSALLIGRPRAAQ